MSGISLDSLKPNESIPTRSRTFSPEVVKQVHAYMTGADGTDPVKNLAVGTFESEGKARSALVTLNRCLVEQQGATTHYSGTVRAQEDGTFRAILINKPAKVVERKPKAAAATGGAAPAAKAGASGAKATR